MSEIRYHVTFHVVEQGSCIQLHDVVGTLRTGNSFNSQEVEVKTVAGLSHSKGDFRFIRFVFLAKGDGNSIAAKLLPEDELR